MEQNNNSKPILNIMVDLETASTKENAAILSWAMVPFMTSGEEYGEEPYYKVVELKSCFLAGMDFSKETQKWWMKQDAKAKADILSAEGSSIQSVSKGAYDYLACLAEQYDLYMWCRGIDFDLPKMEWCFNRFVEKPLPYKYSHKMDVRTVLKFVGIDQTQYEFEGVKHNAVSDCMHDIKMVTDAYNTLRLKRFAAE